MDAGTNQRTPTEKRDQRTLVHPGESNAASHPLPAPGPFTRQEKHMDDVTKTDINTSSAGKHTPGPWRVSKEDKNVWANNGVLVAIAHGPRGVVMQVEAEHKANQILIAASPKLLSFLKDKARIFQGGKANAQDYAEYLAIISEAEGK